MENYSIGYILNAIEELETYIPLLENQEEYNHTVITHSVDALRQTFTNYKHNYYGTTK